MERFTTQPIVFQPAAARGLRRGIEQLVAAIQPTLGPRPRLVAIAPVLGSKPPELLDSGGVIARRLTDLPDRDADMGAMLLRGLLWRLHEEVGDGTATAAVLFGAVYRAGLRHLAAGADAMRLRHHLERGLRLVLDELAGLAAPVSGREQLARVAAACGADEELAALLGEIFDVIGEWGRLDVRSGHGRGLEREYVEGMHWDGGLLSPGFLTDPVKREARLEAPAILLGDLAITDAQQLVPALEAAREAGARSLVVVARELSDDAIALLLLNRRPSEFGTLAVKTPAGEADARAALEDLAALTGGRPLFRAAGDTPRDIGPPDLGRARRAWANADFFGIAGGKGDPRALRRHIAALRAAFAAADPPAREGLRQRIGLLLGGTAMLWVGGASEPAIDARKATAERVAGALRGALREGVLPGGGAALLACRAPLLARRERSDDPDERAACAILAEALAAPARALAANAGRDFSALLPCIERAGPGHGLDVVSGRVVDLARAGIVDPAAAQRAAVQGAIASAALALTIDVLVHHRHPEEVFTP